MYFNTKHCVFKYLSNKISTSGLDQLAPPACKPSRQASIPYNLSKKNPGNGSFPATLSGKFPRPSSRRSHPSERTRRNRPTKTACA